MNALAISNRPFAILGTGHALPQRTVTSAELDHQLGFPSGRVFKVGGIKKRYFASAGDNAAKLGVQAARKALEAANLSLSDIDCLVAANGTMDQSMPCNAALIYKELGELDTALSAFDINASCMSFITALDTLSWAIAAGQYRRVLIVSSDIASCGLDWRHLEASAIFGDGAAAAVVGLSENNRSSRILNSSMRTFPQGATLCEIKGGGSRYHPTRINEPFEPLALFRMDGKGVFRLATTHLPDFVHNLLKGAGLTHDEIDWVVPHQASHLALQHLARRIGFRREQVIDIFAEHGNQVAASLPTALDYAIRDGRIRRGQRVLLIGTGAGLSLGGMVLEY